MKFIVDAQLPERLARWLKEQGLDAIHTLDLPAQNLTGDVDIVQVSTAQQRVVISKDSDFFEYYLLKGQPHKLLFITAGNMVNRDLIALFEVNWPQLFLLLEQHHVVEMDKTHIVVHF
jgi:predicted nuclease of predicted toxin-antitoxin system